MRYTLLILTLLVVALFTGVSSVSAAATTSQIILTVPNGGEAWEIGSGGTITWSPYSYNPDVNPANDVIAYLEKRVGAFYFPIGTIM
ncbi:MAG: hypothetical protein WBK28_00350, partial [Minisyncoccia bacterium]